MKFEFLKSDSVNFVIWTWILISDEITYKICKEFCSKEFEIDIFCYISWNLKTFYISGRNIPCRCLKLFIFNWIQQNDLQRKSHQDLRLSNQMTKRFKRLGANCHRGMEWTKNCLTLMINVKWKAKISKWLRCFSILFVFFQLKWLHLRILS